MYVEKIIKARDKVLVKRYSARLFGAPNESRIKRLRKTPKAMEKYNQHQRAEKLQMLMILNFDKGFHVILDYPKDNRPKSYEEAEANLKKALYKISRRFKSQGKQFKYIAITERGKRAAALHHHMIVEGASEVVEELVRTWGQHIKVNAMYDEGLYKDLAEYFCKVETKEEQEKGKSKYHRSRNLKEPVTKSRIRPGTFKNDPEVPEGYRLVEHSLKNGVNEIVGIKYQRYMLRKEQAETTSDLKGNEKRTIWGAIKGLFKKRRQ